MRVLDVMSASRILICIAVIALVAAFGTTRRAETVTKPAAQLSCTLKKPGERCVFQ